MRPGDTYIITRAGAHLIVILSDPAKYPDRIVVANLTSWKANKDQSCILKPGDHPWIKHKTVVNYRLSKITTMDILKRQIKFNMISVDSEPVTPQVLNKIIAGAGKSRMIPTGVKNALKSMGLLS